MAFSTKSLLQLHFLSFFQGCLWLTVNFDFLVPSPYPRNWWIKRWPAPGNTLHPSVPVDSSSRILLAHPFHGRVDPQMLLHGEVRPERVLLRAVTQEGGRVVLEVGGCSVSPLHQHLHNQADGLALTQPCPETRVWCRGRLWASLGFRGGNPKSKGLTLQPSFTWFLNINMAD